MTTDQAMTTLQSGVAGKERAGARKEFGASPLRWWSRLKPGTRRPLCSI